MINAESSPATRSPASQPLLSMTGLRKSFGGVQALRGAELHISGRGVVHALVGENGSGKSTLLNILAGQISPDAGQILLDGKAFSFGTPPDALAAGIAMVSQETAVAPELSVAENVLLGRRMVRGRFGLSPASTRRRAVEVLDGLGLAYDPAAKVRDLRPDQQQMVEIARAVSMEAQILILDEPTSSLTDIEVAALYKMVRDLKANGVSILFVSHRLDDLFAVADEATVLRDGVTVLEANMADMNTASLVHAMVGEAAEHRATTRSAGAAATSDQVALSVEGLCVKDVLRDISFTVNAGEIVGISGLAGAGRTELLEALFGVRPCEGVITVAGRPFTPSDPRSSIASGIGFLPADRKTQALMLSMSVQDNLTVVDTLDAARWSYPRAERELAIARTAHDAMGVRASSLRVLAGTLSGGNQQKVALGKWLASNRSVLLLDEPTRGVDVAAKLEIQERLRALAADGVAIVVSSSEYDQLLDMCDRIVVLFGGRSIGMITSEQATEAELAKLAGGRT